VTVAAAGLGLLIGLVFGAVGGGGSVLTVPVLVYVLGQGAQEATTTSLVIVGITATVAAVSHSRSGGTSWRAGLLLAAAGVPASLLGTALNRRADHDVLLLTFAALLLVAAAGMLGAAAPEEGPHDRPVRRGRVGWAAPLVAGLAVGALTGFFGVGGGFVLVPVLVLALGYPMALAIGTSLLVIALNAAVALLARAGSLDVDPEVAVPFTLAAVAGSLAGARMSSRLPAETVGRAFGGLLVLVALYTGARSAAGLL
jgi:hypothetical protein